MDVSSMMAPGLFGIGSAAALLAATHVVFPVRRRTIRCYLLSAVEPVPKLAERKSRRRTGNVIVMPSRWEERHDGRAE